VLAAHAPIDCKVPPNEHHNPEALLPIKSKIEAGAMRQLIKLDLTTPNLNFVFILIGKLINK